MLKSNTTGASHWNLLHVIHDAPRIAKWLLDFLENLCTLFVFPLKASVGFQRGKKTLTLPLDVLRSCKTYVNSKTIVRHYAETEVPAVASARIASSDIK